MRIIKILFFLAISCNRIMADVIYSPFVDRAFFLSLEAIGSYEIPISEYNTINPWGGFGFVSAFGDINHPSFGGEISIELRQYFLKSKFRGFNLGLYAGIAYMRYPMFYNDEITNYENSFGFVPGLKLAYKFRINSWLIIEPYLGISIPFYREKSHKNSGLKYNNGLDATMGIRIGFNKVRNMQN